jgi:hypothetical protein
MTNIAEVIGWKHNHQPGMSTREGIITEFPGGIPSQADQDKWTAEYEAQFPTMEWKEKMAESDGPLPRWAEDLVDGSISSQTQKLSEDKKALRATKP